MEATDRLQLLYSMYFLLDSPGLFFACAPPSGVYRQLVLFARVFAFRLIYLASTLLEHGSLGSYPVGSIESPFGSVAALTLGGLSVFGENPNMRGGVLQDVFFCATPAR